MFRRDFGQESQSDGLLGDGIRQSENIPVTEKSFNRITYRITSRQRKYIVQGCM